MRHTDSYIQSIDGQEENQIIHPRSVYNTGKMYFNKLDDLHRHVWLLNTLLSITLEFDHAKAGFKLGAQELTKITIGKYTKHQMD